MFQKLLRVNRRKAVASSLTESGLENDTIEQMDSGNNSPTRVSWSNIPPEILKEIIGRLEVSEDRWPLLKNVVACGGVCKRWREFTLEAAKSSLNEGKITFPSCLKQPGPCDTPMQCFIRRDKKNKMFYLYLGLAPSPMDTGKLLLVARRFGIGTKVEYIISLDAGDLSQTSKAYVGKLRSNILGINYTIYDNQSSDVGSKPSSSRNAFSFSRKKITPQVPAGNSEVGHVSYKTNFMHHSGPRRMIFPLNSTETTKDQSQDVAKTENGGPATVMTNKPPRWHEKLQVWCLNFHGRVTRSSMKNFQLLAPLDEGQPEGKGDAETVVLQFGKVGDDTFTMDYRKPLSAFQAFAICLTSFGTKVAC